MKRSTRLGFGLIGWNLAIAVTGCSAPHAASQPASPGEAPAGQKPTRIDSFSGEYRFLSNFWPAEVEFEGQRYPSVEHAYQAAKTLDPVERRRIATQATPSAAKRAGRALVLRDDWLEVKLDVMESCVRDKFTRHAELRRRLLETGDAELVEGNTWGDRYWGVFEGQGENHLGKILMKIRGELRAKPTD